jgi:hypothetical protein
LKEAAAVNPLQWTGEHKIAWAVVCAVGAALGVLLGFIHSPIFSLTQPWHVFVQWLSLPSSYWRWPVFGFLMSGLVFYAAQLFRKSN